MSWFRRNISHIAFISFALLFLLYFTVEFQENEHVVEIQDSNNATQEEAMLYYARGDTVPVKMIGDEKGSFLSTTGVFFFIAILILYIVLFLKKPETGRYNIDQSKQMISDTLHSRIDVDKYIILDTVYWQSRQMNDGQAVHNRWCHAKVKFKDSMQTLSGWYFLAYRIDPNTNEIMEAIPLEDAPIGTHHRCDVCGKFPDVKVITTEEAKKLRGLFGGKK